jgi:hypothetical protein
LFNLKLWDIRRDWRIEIREERGREREGAEEGGWRTCNVDRLSAIQEVDIAPQISTPCKLKTNK